MQSDHTEDGLPRRRNLDRKNCCSTPQAILGVPAISKRIADHQSKQDDGDASMKAAPARQGLALREGKRWIPPLRTRDRVAASTGPRVPQDGPDAREARGR